MAGGRPIEYTKEIGDKICAELSSGKSLLRICAEAKISRPAVFNWLYKVPEFAANYAHAREIWADAEFDNLLQIADDGSNDTYVDEDGNVKVDHDVVARSRLRIDTRKWALARMSPRKYSERTTVDTNINVSLTQLIEQSLKPAVTKTIENAITPMPALSNAEETPED